MTLDEFYAEVAAIRGWALDDWGQVRILARRRPTGGVDRDCPLTAVARARGCEGVRDAEDWEEAVRYLGIRFDVAERLMYIADYPGIPRFSTAVENRNRRCLLEATGLALPSLSQRT